MTWLRLVIAGCLIGACSVPDSDPGSSSETPADTAGGPTRGEILSLACQACHSLQQGGRHLVGPNLFGVFGRRAGTAAGYEEYSQALRAVDLIWTPESLDRWLADPAGYLPGTSMTFTGYQSSADRAALIEFLVDATGSARGQTPE